MKNHEPRTRCSEPKKKMKKVAQIVIIRARCFTPSHRLGFANSWNRVRIITILIILIWYSVSGELEIAEKCVCVCLYQSHAQRRQA